MTNLINKPTASQIHLTFKDESRKKIIEDFRRIILVKGEYKDFTEALFQQVKRYNKENEAYLNLKPTSTNVKK